MSQSSFIKAAPTIANTRTRRRAGILLIALTAALLVGILGRSLDRQENSFRLPWSPAVPPPGLAPGAEAAVRRALGDDGVARITQTVSPGNLVSVESGGTHRISGCVDGVPYGLAFDIGIVDPTSADEDVHRLRLQGIAAWHRDLDSPGGLAGNGPHIHCVWPGAKTANIQNLEQISSFVHGYRGLVGHGTDTATWCDVSITPTEVAAVRAVYATVPKHRPLRDLTPYELRHHRGYAASPLS